MGILKGKTAAPHRLEYRVDHLAEPDRRHKRRIAGEAIHDRGADRTRFVVKGGLKRS
jgi:predicted transcriptional regulator